MQRFLKNCPGILIDGSIDLNCGSGKIVFLVLSTSVRLEDDCDLFLDFLIRAVLDFLTGLFRGFELSTPKEENTMRNPNSFCRDFQ